MLGINWTRKNKNRLVKSIIEEFAPILLSSGIRKQPLPPIETLTGTWRSKLSKPLESTLSLKIKGEEVTLSRHTLSFMCSLVETHKNVDDRWEIYRLIAQTLDKYRAPDWFELTQKDRAFRRCVVSKFLKHIMPDHKNENKKEALPAST